MKKTQPARKPSRSTDPNRTELLSRLCTVFLGVRAQKEGEAWRAALIRACLSGAYVDYYDTGNPLHLLNGFVTARRAGVPVPEWVLQPLTAAIDMFLADKGKITLNDALDFTPNKGQRNKWTEQEQHLQDARRKWLFDQQLKKGLPLNSDAAGAPSAVNEVANILRLDIDKHDRLLQTYQKRLKKHSSRLSR